MSTYNGERYLREQLDSILSQDVENLSIVVRDDGSSDGTVSILAEYESRGDIRLIRGENMGYVRSFFAALKAAGNHDYYCFADQDDIWLPDKISAAVTMIEDSHLTGPVLYASELLYCDEKCENPRKSHLNRIGFSPMSMIYEIICSGNTQVLNHELKELVMRPGCERAFGHDWWTGLVAVCFGEIVWDDTPHLLYRRVEDSESPSGMSALQLASYRVRKIFFGGQLSKISKQARQFYSVYGKELQGHAKEAFEVAVSGGRIRRAFLGGRYRQKKSDELLLRVALLLGFL